MTTDEHHRPADLTPPVDEPAEAHGETVAPPDAGPATASHRPGSDAPTADPTSPAAAPGPSGLPGIPGYAVEAEIARGGMGVVYRARHLQLNRPAAIKMILGGRHHDPTARVRFLIEAEAVAALDHPHVVHVHEFGTHDGMPFFALEFVGGGTLAQKLKRDGKPPARAAAGLVAKLADGIAAAHARGIVHRDLKPANVLLTDAGEPKIADFGLAKVGQSDMTATGAVMGTPSYMSPEQAAGRTKEVGTATDVYALGAILYELLTGRPPFLGESTMETIQQVLTREPERPRTIDASIPRDLETIALKCLAKEPARRYASCAELAEDLRRFGAGEPVSARPVGQLERVFRWARRKPTAAAAWGLAALVVAFGTGAGVAVRERSRAETARQDAEKARSDADAARAEAVAAREHTEWVVGNVRALNDANHFRYEFRDFEPGDKAKTARAVNRTFMLGGHWEWRHCRERVVGAGESEVPVKAAPLDPLVRNVSAPVAACFSADSTALFFVTADGGIAEWDCRTGRARTVRPATPSAVTAVSHVPSGNRIATAHVDGRVRLWDRSTGAAAGELPVASQRAALACIGQSQLVIAGRNMPLTIWDVRSGAAEQVRVAPRLITSDVTELAVTPDGTGVSVLELEGGGTIIAMLPSRHDGNPIASVGYASVITLVDPATWSARGTSRHQTYRTLHYDARFNTQIKRPGNHGTDRDWVELTEVAAFVPDGERKPRGCRTGVSVVETQFSKEGGAKQVRLNGPITDAIMLDANRVMLAHETGEVTVWANLVIDHRTEHDGDRSDTNTSTAQVALLRLPAPDVCRLLASPDRTTVAGFGVGGSVRVWRAPLITSPNNNLLEFLVPEPQTRNPR